MGIRDQFETEVFSYGYLPLAYSARCFTARAEDRAKDDCETCCIKYPNGITVNSQEEQKVFTLNGIQTQSGYCYSLINDLKSMANLVDVVRLSPLDSDTLSLIDTFRSNELGGTQHQLEGGRQCNGYCTTLPDWTSYNPMAHKNRTDNKKPR